MPDDERDAMLEAKDEKVHREQIEDEAMEKALKGAYDEGYQDGYRAGKKEAL